ncbi:2-phospho-L-lactate transferase [Aquihabitans sp. G128]|uniref:2-phospho-L-lactate transferase n=1 Tax=Aquihabitans sp. G128 TaxID=2849779 RepID=UPI001C22414F|nr:2-phospho-L-lactate transferase [Aquihabitans sp. G128]QXC61440.1 2-phospho-L-lactate transferase [Aquihabitans sp. G128]
MAGSSDIVVVSGGVGAARMLSGIVQVVDPDRVTALVNVGDDLELHGLRISPDLDTITYTLAGEINPETGWGLRGESWQAMDSVKRYGGISWFGLGDRDLGTHLYRTQRVAEGATLSEVTAEIVAAWGLDLRLQPVTDDRLRTMVTLDGEGDEAGLEVSFQEYFVQRQHGVPVRSVRFDGAASASPAPGVLDLLGRAGRIVIAPSNPIVSIDPVLAVPGVRAAVEARRDDVVAVSPIIAGSALKGPADRLLVELGHEATVLGIARLYAPLAATLVIDEADAALADLVEAEGLRAVVAPSVMKTPELAAGLARVVLDGREDEA